jgi:hypothetical protein
VRRRAAPASRDGSKGGVWRCGGDGVCRCGRSGRGSRGAAEAKSGDAALEVVSGIWSLEVVAS